MKPVDLVELRKGYRGRRYADLVQYHLERQTPQARIEGLLGTVQMLPGPVQPAVEGFIDKWNARAYDQGFWQSDTADVFDEITADARHLMVQHGVPADDETLFNLFNIITMSYAYSAAEQPKMRKFIGIKNTNDFPVWSGLALLIPIFAFLRISGIPADPIVRVGYALAQLGYVLFAAGLFAGTFRILGLRSRPQVFGSAVAVFILGTILSNLGD
jgi:hypothetical protein